MVIHFARSCLQRKSSPCSDKKCLARQRVLCSYFKFVGKRLLQIAKQGAGENATNQVYGGRFMGRQGRTREIQKRARSKKSVFVPQPRKRYIERVVGGAPKERIDVKRYVEAYQLCNLPLRPTLSLRREAKIVAKHYYKENKVTASKMRRIWRFHNENYVDIGTEYNKLAHVGIMPTNYSNSRETFAIKLCCGIVDHVLLKTANTHSMREQQQYATAMCSSVCSKIACRILEEEEDRESSTSDDECVDECVDDFDDRKEPITSNDTQHKPVKMQKEQHSFQKEDFNNESKADLTEMIDHPHALNNNLFSKVGFSKDTASILSESCMHRSQGNTTSLMERDVSTDLDPSWRELPIVCCSNGTRRFAGEWTTYFNKLIEKFNPHCVFAFKSNHIKQAASRKHRSPFFKCHAICTIPPCSCKALLQICDESESVASIQFKGEISHNPAYLRARRLTTTERYKIRDELLEGKRPGNLYREKLREIEKEPYAAGNRSGCGVTPKAFQNISSEASLVKKDLDLLAMRIRACDKRIRSESGVMQKCAMHIPKVPGYIQSCDITNESLSLVMLDEGSVYLYRDVAQKDILFVDATGTIIEKIKGLKRILLYSLTTRNPFGRTPPVPLCELVSSAHTAGAISRLFTILQEKERQVFGKNVSPVAIMSDFSIAILSAVVSVFNGISLPTYLNRCYDLVFGKSEVQTNMEPLTLALVCTAHLMKANATNIKEKLQKHSKENSESKKHIAMRIVGLLVNVDCIEDALTIIKLAYIIFMSRRITSQLEVALQQLSDTVNNFKVEETYTYNDASLDFQEKLIDQISKIKLTGHLESMFDRIELEDCAEESESQNKYYFPTYMEYLRRALLPYMFLWTRIMLKSRQTAKMSDNTTNIIGKTFVDKTSTNSYAENYFSFVKQSFQDSSVPADRFIYQHFKDLQGLRRQYIDTVRVGCGSAKISCKGLGNLDKTTPRYPADTEHLIDVDNAVEAEEEEMWQKKGSSFGIPKKASIVSGKYQDPPSTPVIFRPSVNTKRNLDFSGIKRSKASSTMDRMRFQVFKMEQWPSVSALHETPEKCLKDLQRRYTRLSDHEKSRLSTPRPHQQQLRYCICREPYRAADPLMVQCNLCEDWYHNTCIKMDGEFLSKMTPRYHCDQCISKIYHALLNYMEHCKEEGDGDSRKSIKELQDELSTLESETEETIKSHTFLPDVIERSDISLRALNHFRGIENTSFNCWLNSVIHLVCGTGILDLLLSYDGSSSLEVSQLLTLIKVRLAKQSKSSLTLRQVKQLPILLDAQSFDPCNMEQKDALEFYTCLITHYFERIPSERMVNDFRIVFTELRHCIKCKGFAGATYRNTVLNVSVPDSEKPITLPDLIWSSMRGNFIENDKTITETVCEPTCKSSFVIETTFVKRFPTVLVVNLKRGEWQLSRCRINKTQAIIPRTLELTRYAATGTDKAYNYRLQAAISHYASTNTEGHYACHIFNNDSVTTYDDKTVKRRKADSLLSIETIRASVHVLVYFLEMDNSSYNQENENLLSAVERNFAEKFWFGLLAPASRQLSMEDARTICDGRYINGDVITQFLFALSGKHADVFTTSTLFIDRICRGQFHFAECSYFLQKEDLLRQHAIIVPLHCNQSHWIVSAIYPKAKCIVVIDSMKDTNLCNSQMKKLLRFLAIYAELHHVDFNICDWKLICPKHLPSQTDSSSCGVFACANGFNLMLKERPYLAKPSNVLIMRYWICFIACSCIERPNYSRIEKLGKGVACNISSKGLLITDTVPGYSKFRSFFDVLAKYIRERGDVTRRNDGDIPQNAAKESVHNQPTTNESDEDSSGDDQIKTKERLKQLAPLKHQLLQRLQIDFEKGNERYLFLAAFGKDEFLARFKRELSVLYQNITETDLETLKGALYQLFSNEVDEHNYFSISMPTINCHRFGFTSAQFIDYIILPDALCLDYANTHNVSYWVAVSNICGEKNSRMTVYWDKVMLKDQRVAFRKQVTMSCQLQVIVGGMQEAKADVIVVSLQERTEEADDLLRLAESNVTVLGREQLSGLSRDILVIERPSQLSCDTLIILTGKDKLNLKASIDKGTEKVMLVAFEAGATTLSFVILSPFDKEHLSQQVRSMQQYIGKNANSPVAVVRFAVKDTTMCVDLDDILMN